jgi:hypothetical protein
MAQYNASCAANTCEVLTAFIFTFKTETLRIFETLTITTKTKLRGLSPWASYTHKRPPLVEVNVNFLCE